MAVNTLSMAEMRMRMINQWMQGHEIEDMMEDLSLSDAE
jgi:hypothetical protein